MKNFNIVFSISIITFLLSFSLTAQEGGSLQHRTNENNLRFGLPEEIKTKLDDFFDSMVKRDYKGGLEKLLINSPISRKDNDFSNILKEVGKAIDAYGLIKGYEIVGFNIAGSSYYKVKIIGLHIKLPTR
jgi:hypothetical protein